MCLKSFLSQTERKSDILLWLCVPCYVLIYPIPAYPLECSFAPTLLGMLKRRRRLCGVITTHFPKLGQPPSTSLSFLAACCHRTQQGSLALRCRVCAANLLCQPSARVLSGTLWCPRALQLQDCFHIRIHKLVHFAVSFGCFLRIHGLSYL